MRISPRPLMHHHIYQYPNCLWRYEMSFSDKFPDWSVFAKREQVALDVELLAPAAEVAAVLRQGQVTLDEALQPLQEERTKWLDALAQQAVFVAQFALILDRHSATMEASAY